MKRLNSKAFIYLFYFFVSWFRNKTTESSTGDAVEKIVVDFPVYAKTQLFIEKESTLTCLQVNEALSAKNIEANLED